MHDNELEDRLRATLREEGERLPLRVDVERLEAELAVRRRSRTAGRFGLLAAGIAIVAFGMTAVALNGLTPRTGVGTTASPSPSAPPSSPRASPSASPWAVGGLQPIEPRPDAQILYQVLPTQAGPETGHSFTVGGDRNAATWISVACLGREPADNVEPDIAVINWPDETTELVCLTEQLYSDTVPLGEEQSIRVRVPEGVVYTILAEAVPLPESLPALEELDQPAELEGSSDVKQPDWGAPETLITTTVGTLDEGLAQDIQMVCIGPGTLQLELRPPGVQPNDWPWSGGAIDCIGEPQNLTLAIGLEGPLDVVVTADARTAWHVRALSSGDVPEFTPPTIRMTSWRDGAEQDGAGQPGLAGCDPTGGRASYACGPFDWPDVSDLTPVFATQGGELRIQIEPPWAMSADAWIVRAAGVSENGVPPDIQPLDTGEGDFDGLLVPVDMEPGRWVIRIDANPVNGEERIEATYHFLLDVES